MCLWASDRVSDYRHADSTPELPVKKSSTCLVTFAMAFMFMPPLFAQAYDSGNLAQNPIIWADVPDLAAIRVGDTYFMSSTTMHLSPGRLRVPHRADSVRGSPEFGTSCSSKASTVLRVKLSGLSSIGSWSSNA